MEGPFQPSQPQLAQGVPLVQVHDPADAVPATLAAMKVVNQRDSITVSSDAYSSEALRYSPSHNQPKLKT